MAYNAIFIILYLTVFQLYRPTVQYRESSPVKVRLAETTAIGYNTEAARASHTTRNDRQPRLDVQLDVRPSRLVTVGDRSFASVGPKLWKSLPDDITSASSLSVFRNKLKTHLFRVCLKTAGHHRTPQDTPQDTAVNEKNTITKLKIEHQQTKI